MNRIEKHVVTRSLAEATWVTSALRIHRDGAVRALEEVVSATAGDVLVWGSLTLSRELFANGLVDELWVRVVPLSLGEGVLGGGVGDMHDFVQSLKGEKGDPGVPGVDGKDAPPLTQRIICVITNPAGSNPRLALDGACAGKSDTLTIYTPAG